MNKNSVAHYYEIFENDVFDAGEIIVENVWQEKELAGYPSVDEPWLKYYSKDAIEALLSECTIYEYLWKNNKEHLEDVALDYFGRKISFGKLFDEIERAVKDNTFIR